KKAVLIVEEGFPEYIEQMVATELRRGDVQSKLYGKDVLPQAGEYTQEVLMRGLAQFLIEAKPARLDTTSVSDRLNKMTAHLPAAQHSLRDLPPRPPTFCTGCPERPVFSALKLTQAETGNRHISADIGCHC